MNKEFRLPDVGEGLTEADIVSWHVKPGDTVTINQIIVDIETAKAVVELPSPYAGTVTALLVDEGQTVDVGTPIIAVDVPGAEDAEPEPAPPENPARRPRRKGRRHRRTRRTAAGARRLRRQAGLDEPPAAEEAADAAWLLPGHAVRAADRRAARRRPGRRGQAGSPPGSSFPPAFPPRPAQSRAAPACARPGGHTGRAPAGDQGPGEAARAAPRQGPRRRPGRADGERAGRLGHQGGCRAGGGRRPNPF